MDLLLSFLSYAAKAAPHLIPVLRPVLCGFCKDRGIDEGAALKALDDTLDQKVAAVDAEVDEALKRL